MADIETLDDWNRRMGCCCKMPLCHSPSLNFESIRVYACGFALPPTKEGEPSEYYERLEFSEVNSSNRVYDNGVVQGSDNVSSNYKVFSRASIRKDGACVKDIISSNYSYSSNSQSRGEYRSTESTYHISLSTTTESISAEGGKNENATGTRTVSITTSDTYPGYPESDQSDSSSNTTPFTKFTSSNEGIGNGAVRSGSTFTLSDDYNYGYEGMSFSSLQVITWSFLNRIVIAEVLASKVFPEGVNGSDRYSLLEDNYGLKSRFQFIIPSSHAGTYFKIKWSYLDEPKGWNETIADPSHTDDGPAPQIPKPDRPNRNIVSGGTWIWKGPGKERSSNDPSWKSPWFEIPVPTFKGEKKLVNIEFECYQGPYGTKPQRTGMRFDL